ncbi:MAG: tRNA uridine(34) 5-carboxymethylaminomethyl modification radical SAM/GNAT enzyme Elp3, partial [Candidatus Diapherotrites archaeon]|nr:tRNA uridine(34) 5-carboxymethylaminomethyl modification radical SAM/GNAT enzyme Elp3 [Candidatus Diapherotrites archaeon]
KRELNNQKLVLCKKFGLKNTPSNPDIFAHAPIKTPEIKKVLGVKPTRSLSGVAVVAIMPPPTECPGKCVYCPNSLLPKTETPKSYTGKEPATMRAIKSGFDAKKQILGRLKALNETGHNTEKIELIIMGGTFPSAKYYFQKKFVLDSLNAVTGKKAKNLAEAKKFAENSEKRVVGITFETRPDICGEKEISRMLEFGGTRVELGVQNVFNGIYKKINRGHTITNVVKATQLLKDSAFKVTYHFMPGLPGSSLQKDLEGIKKIFSKQEFRPDSLKIYPCLVIEGTELYKKWEKGEFKPISTEDAVGLVAKIKEIVPRHVRIMRVQRDIPHYLVKAGVQRTNLRQMVNEHMKEKGTTCNCIRCREAGLLSREKQVSEFEEAKVFVESYNASNGKEFFISFEDKKREALYGFTRLRVPCAPFRKEIAPETALIRELHVFGTALPISSPSISGFQHKGLGKELLQKAESIAREKFDAKKLLVISGLGAKQYYFSLGFKRHGCYVSKPLN